MNQRLHTTITDNGTEPAVVLLHSLAMDSSLWDYHVTKLASRHPVVTCDLPGHGRSGQITEASVEWMADEVASVLRRAAFERYVVAGLSLGGCIAQSLAVYHPDLVAGLCLLDTTAWYGDDAPERWEERAQRAASEGFDSLSDFQLERWFSPDFRAREPGVGSRLIEVFRSNDLDSYIATCRAMGWFDIRDRLGEITVPTTVVVGDLDPATPLTHAQVLADGIRGARLTVLNGVSHLSPVERPDLTLQEIEAVHARVSDPS